MIVSGLMKDCKGGGNMSLQKYILALEKLAKEEVKIHKEVLRELSKEPGGMAEVIKEHITDHTRVRHAFISDLKKALRSR